MAIRLEIVTAEKSVFSEDVDEVIAPGIEGQLGILPHHTPLMTTLDAGELRIKKGNEETFMAISGGFIEVRPDRVIVLADAAERSDEIDLARAEEAKKRAEDRLAHRTKDTDVAQVEASLRRALTRLKIGQRRRRREQPLR